MKSADRVVDVAVAVILTSDNKVLLAQRPAGKPMAGYWEFPGGKLEVGESVFDALKREIDEELGLQVEDAAPWVVLPFTYPHASVRLHFMRVWRYHGVAQSKELQAFRFEPINQFSVEPWLPGALPLKRWLRVSARLAISNAAEVGVAGYLARLSRHLEGQPDPFWLVLREPALSPAQFAEFFLAVAPLARSAGLTLLVSSRHAERFWSEADGVVLTSRDMLARSGRPAVRWCLASCHDHQELEAAARLGADAALLGAVFDTGSHPGRAGLGWAGFERLIGQAPLPVFALGGLRLDSQTLETAVAHGAHGVAAQRSAF